MQRQNEKVGGGTGMAAGRQRGIEGPADAGAVHRRRAFHEHRRNQQRERARQQPERDVVHARERHVRRADHEGDHPVAEAADEGGHDREEDHDQRVSGDDDVVGVAVGEDLHPRLLQLHAHGDGQCAADETSDDSEGQVHRADVFVVRGIEPAGPARGPIVEAIHRRGRHVPTHCARGRCQRNRAAARLFPRRRRLNCRMCGGYRLRLGRERVRSRVGRAQIGLDRRVFHPLRAGPRW